MHKMVYMTPEEKSEHIKKYGDYNDLPGEIQKSSYKECIPMLAMWVLEGTESRQIKDLKYRNCTLFYFNQPSANFMIAHSVRGEPEYYKFRSKDACQHEYGESVSKGRCYSEATCTKCGYVHAVDSSD